MPLGLLISEIITAALERGDAEIRPITIQVARDGENGLRVTLAGEALSTALPQIGLSARLVQAYQAQLGARLSTPDDESVLLVMSVEAVPPARPGRVELAG